MTKVTVTLDDEKSADSADEKTKAPAEPAVSDTNERTTHGGKTLKLNEQQMLVYDTWDAMFDLEHSIDSYIWVEAVYPDHIIVRDAGKNYRVDYTVGDENDIVFAPREEWVEVWYSSEWLPVKEPGEKAKAQPDHDHGNTLKAVDVTDTHMRVANYIVLFEGRDLTGHVLGANPDGTSGEYFKASTQFSSPYTETGMLYVDWEHGRGGLGEPQRDDILGVVDWKTAEVRDDGLWVERVLDRRNQYMQFIEPLIEAGMIGNSSEAVGSGVERDENGHIRSWPLKRDTLTVSPMEPRMLLENQVALRAIKGLAELSPELADLLPEDAEKASEHGETKATEDATETNNDPDDKTSSSDTLTPENKEATMSDQTAVATFTEDDVKAFVDAALTQFAAKTAAPAPDEKGFVVVEDEADKKAKQPWKSFGEFLTEVKHAATPGKAVDPRLRTKATGLSEGVPSDGGFLVQTDFASELLKRTYEMGEIASRVRNYPISANANGLTINAIDETSRVNGSRWGGILSYWLNEAGTKTASAPKFRQMELKLKKLIGLCYATDELLQDTTALGAVIMDGFSEEFSFRVEDAIINGSGAGQPLGIMNSPAIVTVAKEVGQAATTIVFENIVKMWARQWGRSRKNAIWLINQDIEPQLYGLNLAVGTGGQTVYLPPGGLSATPYGTLFGRPVLPAEYCQTLGTAGDILLIDPSQYLMIDKGGLESASSIHVRFVYDETAFRFVLRTDGEPGWNSPLTPFKGTNTQSPFVRLATRS